MNLDELKKKHAELGKEIERLEKGRGALRFSDLCVGDMFRTVGGTWKRVKASDFACAFARPDHGSLGMERLEGDVLVVLQDISGNDLPPEKQVRP